MYTIQVLSAAAATTTAPGICDEIYDYVIVGGGTAGLVVANRLSENPGWRVAVIEPGQDVRDNANVTDVGRFMAAFGTEIDWDYTTTPQAGAGNRSLSWHAGKAIGGTSTINGMTYIRAEEPQIDAWEKLGNKGWNWTTLFPYYKNTESFTPPSPAQVATGTSFDSEVHGFGGNLHVGYPYSLVNGSLNGLVADTWKHLGYSANNDLNAGNVTGFSIWPQTLDREQNVRFDSARAYYYPVENRPNLRLINGTAKRIAWKGPAENRNLTADGVEYFNSEGESCKLQADKEVILSAGALRSPLILESSGIGNQKILEKLGIETKIDLPGVGEHLQERPNTIMAYNSTLMTKGQTSFVTFPTAKDLFGDIAPGIKSLSSARMVTWAQMIANASEGGLQATTIEKLLRIQHELIFEKHVSIGEILIGGGGNTLYGAMWLSLPFSWGSVHLRSADSIDSPVIDPRYFQADFDMYIQTSLGRLTQNFFNTDPIKGSVGNLLGPPGILPLNATDGQWAGYIGHTLNPNHHAIGTAAMMSRDLGGVVDNSLKVHGTHNVRVVDASVFPLHVSGHPTSTLYAIAERAADLIKMGIHTHAH
ncbi:GMC oxidoreductase [Poronia punctata]|nr:GMC oxidoreductase [Poronia punctata]